MVIHSVVPLLFLLAHETPPPTPPTAPAPPSRSGEKREIWDHFRLRPGGPQLHPLVDYLWPGEEGEGEVDHIILLTVTVPIWPTHWPLQCYSRWSGRAGFPLQSGHIFTKLDSSGLSCGFTGAEITGIIFYPRCRDHLIAIQFALNEHRKGRELNKNVKKKYEKNPSTKCCRMRKKKYCSHLFSFFFIIIITIIIKSMLILLLRLDLFGGTFFFYVAFWTLTKIFSCKSRDLQLALNNAIIKSNVINKKKT